LRQAFAERLVLVTRDKDFGALIFRDGEPHNGVLRLSGEMNYAEQSALALQTLAHHADDLGRGAIVTVDTNRVRVSLPSPRH
jgi:predicted nuclease of predicted toxin-antitoxin system